MEEIDNYLRRLKNIISNFKKAPNRRYLKQTLTKKLKCINIIYDKLLELVEDLDEDKQKFQLRASRELCAEAKLLIKYRLENLTRLISFKNTVIIILTLNKLYKSVHTKHTLHTIIQNAKMPKVDFKLGTSLVQTYDGSPENLNTFVDAVILFRDNTLEEFQEATVAQIATANETLLKFIKTRLTGTARQAISSAQNLDEILNTLKEQCGSKINSDNIKSKLGTLKQKGSIDDFCEQVEKLTLTLATTYINESIPANKANQMATKQGVDTLINGISNNDTKIILRAGKFDKINEATQKVQECEQSKPAQAQVFMARGNQPQRGRGNPRGNFNYQARRYNNPYRQYSNWSNENRFNQNQNYRFQRGQGNYRGRYGVPRYPNQFPQQQQQQQYQQRQQQYPQRQQYQQPQQQRQLYYTNTNQSISQQQQENLQPTYQLPVQQNTTQQQTNSNFLGGPFGQHTQ